MTCIRGQYGQSTYNQVLPGATLIVTKTEAARASGLASEASIVSLYTIGSGLLVIVILPECAPIEK